MSEKKKKDVKVFPDDPTARTSISNFFNGASTPAHELVEPDAFDPIADVNFGPPAPAAGQQERSKIDVSSYMERARQAEERAASAVHPTIQFQDASGRLITAINPEYTRQQNERAGNVNLDNKPTELSSSQGKKYSNSSVAKNPFVARNPSVEVIRAGTSNNVTFDNDNQSIISSEYNIGARQEMENIILTRNGRQRIVSRPTGRWLPPQYYYVKNSGAGAGVFGTGREAKAGITDSARLTRAQAMAQEADARTIGISRQAQMVNARATAAEQRANERLSREIFRRQFAPEIPGASVAPTGGGPIIQPPSIGEDGKVVDDLTMQNRRRIKRFWWNEEEDDDDDQVV